METTELSLPPELPYPIIISSLQLHPPAQVGRGARLLTYSYNYVFNNGSEARFGTWDSPIEGTLDSWKIKAGETISQKRSGEPVVLVNEPCKHGMQVGGLCGLCGKDMTDFDYTGFSNASRANIQMTHSATGPTVSLEEAQRFERETAAHLIRSRKLSLIVDLDQTIVHATVDPTVGEWIAEGEAWDTKRGEDAGEEAAEDVNPNWEALKDVKKFRLGTEGVAPRTPFQWHKGKERLDAEGCMYYIKPRPGLEDFLGQMSEKFEMHVYTMGTRAYAEAVCATIDPDGTIFRGRLLSRDESGSLTQKSLQRLFPCDTSMVVIIDDRADVWEWSPNLLKVRPYDFFVGIGDINSTFLPKAPSLVPTPPPAPPARPPPAPGSSTLTTELPLATAAKEKADADAAFASQNQMTMERIAAQVEERPLAKKQEELLEGEAKVKEGDKDGAKTGVNGLSETGAEHKPASAPTKALLKNDDTELVRVAGLLGEVHRRFYDAYDARLPDAEPKKRKAKLLDGQPAEVSVPHDVKIIIPRIRAETLAGTHILFSSVIPLDVDPPTSEIWRTAEVFGATCHTALSSHVTHVVAAKRGTAKVDSARRRGGIHIVWLAWFLDSLALWRRQDESPYLIDAEPGTRSTTPPSARPEGGEQSFPDSGDTDEQEDLEEGEGEGELITPDADIWADANAEVDAVLDETDDEDGGASQLGEDDDGGWRTDGSRASSAAAAASPGSNGKGKKRARSSSVSDSGRSSAGGGRPRASYDVQSPLAKRKKLSAARRGSSRLKVGLSAEDLEDDGMADRLMEESDGESDGEGEGEAEAEAEAESGRAESEGRGREEQDSATSTDGNGEEDDEDDFLAREMAEELG